MTGSKMKCGFAITFAFVVLLRLGECADGSYEVSFESYYDINDGDSSPQERPLVHLPTQGSFEGDHFAINGTDINIMRFLGIKYGNVPIGGRFKRGLHVDLSHSSRKTDASKEPMPCPSFPDLDMVMENEARGINVDDCLTLSVFTRKLQSATYLDSNTAVVVYIHGESLFDGSAEEAKPDYLLKNEVVLVSVNYRLAPFGFLFDNNTHSMPGNVALADLEMALQWISKNIIFFGGDPNNISIMGQSGGATLAHALALSGKAKQYFHKMILMGGTALNPYLIEDNAEKTAIEIAKHANCRVYRLDDVGRCLYNKKSSEILRAFYNYKKEHSFNGGNKIIVGDLYNFIPKHPALMIKDPERQLNIPLLAGVTQHFGAYLISSGFLSILI
ncbi:CES5A.2 family protein [Megaselia abdita]